MKKRTRIRLACLNNYLSALIFKRFKSDGRKRVAGAVVSLTSYGWRLQNVHKTIISLLAQDLKPDKILLYVAREDHSNVPSHLWKLTGRDFEIRICDDIKSYKKIIPAIEWLNLEGNDYSWLVLCDDDILYPRGWFSSFNLQNKNTNVAVAHRCHLVAYGRDGNYLRYSKWRKDISDFFSNEDPFPTSGGGLAIPFKNINPYFYKTRDFLSLAPTSDDVWIYFMLRYSGIKIVHSGYKYKLQEWTSLSPRKDRKLWDINGAFDADGITENDRAIIRCKNSLEKLFGDVIVNSDGI